MTKAWDRDSGRLNLETQLENAAFDGKPDLVDDAPGDGKSAKFDGRHRIRVGEIDMKTWTALTVAAWIKTTRNDPNMRVISKDDIGTPGNFVLLQKSPETWEFRVWDSTAKRWAAATWRGNLSDGKWHHLCAVADSAQKRVSLFADGELRGQADWNAIALDDSDETALTVGADSGDGRFGHAFRGLIHDVRIWPRALDAKERDRLINWSP